MKSLMVIGNYVAGTILEVIVKFWPSLIVLDFLDNSLTRTTLDWQVDRLIGGWISPLPIRQSECCDKPCVSFARWESEVGNEIRKCLLICSCGMVATSSSLHVTSRN
jgi:hypothetical protein